MRALLLIIGTLVAAGRLTIPGRELAGWPGAYEAFAHIWIGVLLVFAVAPVFKSLRWIAVTAIIALTAIEVCAFLLRPIV